MITFNAEVKNEKGQIEERKFELRDPDFERWLEDAGEGLSGFEIVDQ